MLEESIGAHQRAVLMVGYALKKPIRLVPATTWPNLMVATSSIDVYAS